MKKEIQNKDKSIGREIGRFIICGIITTVIDYLFCQLTLLIINSTLASLSSSWKIAISTAIGFIISVIVSYFISTKWVYKNVEKKENTKKAWFIILFVAFSLCAFFLSWGIMELCNLLTKNSWNIDITKTDIISLIKEYGISFLGKAEFWAYAISFVFKTIIGMAFNYVTRKFVLYRAPKENKTIDKTIE